MAGVKVKLRAWGGPLWKRNLRQASSFYRGSHCDAIDWFVLSSRNTGSTESAVTVYTCQRVSVGSYDRGWQCAKPNVLPLVPVVCSRGDMLWVLTIPFMHKQEIRVEGSVEGWWEQRVHTGSRQARKTADYFRGIQGQDKERGVRRSLWKEAVWLALLGLKSLKFLQTCSPECGAVLQGYGASRRGGGKMTEVGH